MFGFALWDARRRRLIVGRDRLGVKPIYVYRDARRLAFASEAKALLALPGVSAGLDPAALHSYLNLGYVAAPHSMFRGIAKLPPATLLVGRGRPRRGAPLLAHPGRRRTGRPPEREWIERVRARLDESVRMQMVSDVPIGAFLSGRHRLQHGGRAAWRRTATGRSAPTPSASRAPRRTSTTTSCRTRAGSRSCSAPSTTRSWCGPTWSRCCRGCCGTWTSRSPTPRSSRPTSSRSSPAAT